MCWFKLQDILFQVTCMKEPAEHFYISTYVTFVISNTRASSVVKLRHTLATSQLLSSFISTEMHIYATPSPPLTIQIYSHQSSAVSSNTYGTNSSSILTLTPHAPFILFVHVLPALTFHDLNSCSST